MLSKAPLPDFAYRPTDGIGADKRCRRHNEARLPSSLTFVINDIYPRLRNTAAPSVMALKRSKSPSAYRKPCSLCEKPRDVLVRCRIDDTMQWNFVCPGSCWREVSGGVVDGTEDKPNYVYGGMWKNKHAGVSARKPKKKSSAALKDWSGSQSDYIQNERVKHEGKLWICRRSHKSSGKNAPSSLSYRYWNEAPSAAADQQSVDDNINIT